MKRPSAADPAVGPRQKIPKALLKRPATAEACTLAKRPAALEVLEKISLPSLAPVYHPSKRPKPESMASDIKDPPRSRCKVVKDASFNQRCISTLVPVTPPILKLVLSGGGISKPPVLDFTAASIRFPEMTHLEIENWPLTSGSFTESVFPKLQSLQIRFPFDGEAGTPKDWNGFCARLPDLRELILEHPGTVQPVELKAATQACPKLNYFCLYKVYVETLGLVLPCAEHIWLHRMEFLKSVSIYAPCVKEVRLQACYDLKHVKMLHKAQGVSGGVDQESRFVLDVTNCCFNKAEIESLREIPRVKYLVVPSDEDSLSEDGEEDDGDGSHTGIFKLGHLMKPPGMTTMQLKGICGMSRFGDEVGVRIHEKVQTARRMDVKQVARLLEWGAQALYAWYDLEVSAEAQALAKKAKVPLRFWQEVTDKSKRATGKMPILSWMEDMEKQIRKAQA